MSVIPQPPLNVKECVIYKQLLISSTADDGLAEKVNQFVTVATPLLDMIIAGPFKEYTLHNRDHAKKVLHIAGIIVGEDLIRKMSSVELAIITMVSYLHDMGMSVTSTERNRIIQDEEFVNTIHEWSELSQQITFARDRIGSNLNDSEKMVVETELFQFQEAALCAYLRPRHAIKERYKNIINRIKAETGRNDLFEHHNVSFEDYLIDICVSHNLEVGALTESKGLYEDRFPRDTIIGGESLNTQFCAALLRLADILDFDRERTPRILFESLGISSRIIPGAEVSLREWNKHMAIHSIEINDEEIVINADTHHPAVERTIRDFCESIEREVRDTMAVLKRNTPKIIEQYSFFLPNNVRPRIRSFGYVYKDISFKLNQSAIMNLLMGDRLYSKRVVAVRELAQNAIDACEARTALESAGYNPVIEIKKYVDNNGSEWLEVSDNGIGMDEYVLSNYFFKVGSCYYNSTDFSRLLSKAGNKKLSMISRFGIGVISTFLIGDWLEVTTQNKYSTRGDYKNRTLKVEARGGLAFVTENDNGNQGTIIRVMLKPKYMSTDYLWSQFRDYIVRTIVRPKFHIHVQIPEFEALLMPNNYYQLKENAMQYLSQLSIEPVVINLERWSEYISGIVVLLFFKNDDNSLSYISSSKKLKLGTTIDPSLIINKYNGNRLSVDGFAMYRIKKILGIFRADVNIPIIADININGVPEVKYDISRDKIVDSGLYFVRKNLRIAVKSALSELKIHDRLTPETQEYMNIEEVYHTELNSEVLEKVIAILPKNKWPLFLHKIVAKELGISNSLAFKAISHLIDKGIVKKPKD